MKAMILAAGVGSRLDPLTRNLPKPMVPILNRPVVEHILRLLARHGFTDIMVNLHHLADQIRNDFGDGDRLGVRIHYSEESELLGTAGGVKKVADFFDDTFIVIGGDDLADIDLSTLIKFHKEKQSLATLALALVDDPSEYGVALLNEHGRIARFVEKPKGEFLFSNTVNTGVYVFEPQIFHFIPQDRFFDFGRDVFPLLLQQKEPFFGCLTANYWCDVGNLAQYRQAHFDFLEGRVKLEIPLKEIRRFVWMGDNVRIDPSAEVGYPVAIGSNCTIGPKAKVLENSVIGENCVIESGAVVTRSILWENARIEADTTLHRCVVGTNCHVSSNAAIFDGVLVEPNGSG
ncbi:MAG: NDP-sugar synthase [Armatimonadetes bacterium]|nr:NDP-sugar synthase [Armatimonadota bacterium]